MKAPLEKFLRDLEYRGLRTYTPEETGLLVEAVEEKVREHLVSKGYTPEGHVPMCPTIHPGGLPRFVIEAGCRCIEAILLQRPLDSGHVRSRLEVTLDDLTDYDGTGLAPLVPDYVRIVYAPTWEILAAFDIAPGAYAQLATAAA